MLEQLVRSCNAGLPNSLKNAMYNDHNAVQGHSRSPILVPIKSSYDFLLVINSNLPPILHRFRDIAVDRSEITIFFCLTFPTVGFPWDDIRKILPGCQQMANVPYGIETLPKISIAWVGCTNVTDRRQTTDDRQSDGWRPIANVNVSSRSRLL